jgi:hypothetical protein
MTNSPSLKCDKSTLSSVGICCVTSTCNPLSMFMPYSIPIMVSSSSDDDSEDENPHPHAHLPPDESIEHEPKLAPPLPRWVHSTS